MFSSSASQVSTAANYIEDVFSTYLWDGNATARNIVNGIDLSTKGGLVWTKYRNATNSHRLYDTNRGATKQIFADLTNAEQVAAQSLTAFNTDGFSLGTGQPNENTATAVGWTFAKQPKFFDVVTYTGNASSRTIAHNLGSVPGTIIVKCTSESNQWVVYHRSLSTPTSSYLKLNSTDGVVTGNTFIWDNTAPTSTVFSVGASGFTNNTGQSYVAYLFAHDAGGFGLTGTDNVISCGSYTGNGSTTGPIVNLGYEPQWILVKRASGGTSNWQIIDVMRGVTAAPGAVVSSLFPNLSDAENPAASAMGLNSTGFQITNGGTGVNASGSTYIYIAIRRGPMKVPTTGTSVFSVTSGNFSTPYTVTTGFPVDLCYSSRTGGSARHFNDRLRGPTEQTSYRQLATNTTDAELTGTSAGIGFQSNTSIIDNDWVTGANAAWWNFRRAPGFFDEVCYTGTGAYAKINHNLTVSPQLIINKRRNGSGSWDTWLSVVPRPSNGGALNSTAAFSDFNITVTPTQFDPLDDTVGATFVSYLFATCPGVSKVGSYTGNGTTQTINCGFTGGARFVLIKRTDSTGDWYVYDTARGMTALTDPYLLANTSAAQTATLGSVTTVSTGFALNAAVLADINVNGGSYIFLAIA